MKSKKTAKTNVKTKTKLKTGAKAKRVMPKFFFADEEMKVWASLLEGELAKWPGVKTKPMFGLVSFSRNKSMFAAVPRTRALRSPHSIILKFNPAPAALLEKIKAEPRIAERAPGPGAGWHAFEMHSHEDIKDALWWLNQAFELAAK